MIVIWDWNPDTFTDLSYIYYAFLHETRKITNRLAFHLTRSKFMAIRPVKGCGFMSGFSSWRIFYPGTNFGNKLFKFIFCFERNREHCRVWTFLPERPKDCSVLFVSKTFVKQSPDLSYFLLTQLISMCN